MDIRLIAISRGITMAGAEAGYIALLALAWHLTGDATSASLVLLASVVARTAFAPAAGWIGDHIDRRKVVVWADTLTAIAFGSLFWANSMWHLLVAMLLGTAASMTGGAALDASIPNLVGDDGDALTKANSTVGIGRTVGHMVGPAAGGTLIALFGAHAAFLLDGITSLIAAGLFLLVRGDVGGADASAAPSHHKGAMLAGLRAVGDDAVLRRYAAARMAFCVCFAYVTAAELPLAVEHGVDEAGLGMIISAWCAGSLVGSWLARYLRDAAGQGSTILARVALVSGLVFAATGLTPWFSSILVLMAIGGLSMAFADVAGSTILQTHTEDGVRARVMAAMQGLDSAAWGMNLALAGLVVSATSAGTAYVVASVWCIVAAIGYASIGTAQRARQLDHQLRIARPRHALEAELAESA